MIDTAQVEIEVREIVSRVIKEFENQTKEPRASQFRKTKIEPHKSTQCAFLMFYKGLELGTITVARSTVLFYIKFDPTHKGLSTITEYITHKN